MTSNNHSGEMLVRAGIITAGTLDQALDRQKISGEGLGFILSEMAGLGEDLWIEALTKAFNLKTVSNIRGHSFAPELLALIPADFASQRMVFPLKQKDGMLATAISDPFDSDTLNTLASRTGFKIIPFLARRDDILAAIKANYPDSAATAAQQLAKASTLLG